MKRKLVFISLPVTLHCDQEILLNLLWKNYITLDQLCVKD